MRVLTFDEIIAVSGGHKKAKCGGKGKGHSGKAHHGKSKGHGKAHHGKGHGKSSHCAPPPPSCIPVPPRGKGSGCHGLRGR